MCQRFEMDEPQENDVANGDEEESFAAGMRQNAADYQAHDTDGDNKLDFNEFCALVHEREVGDFSEEELRERFNALDADGSGLVDIQEYVRFSLRDALARSASRVIDLFRQWDEDGSGEIDKAEFRQAIRAMGFDFIAGDNEIDMIFDDFDIDGSGKLDYKELNKQLRQGAGSALDPSLAPGAAGEISTTSTNRHKLRRRAPGETKKGSSLVKGSIDPDSNVPIQEQLRTLLTENAVRVIDLFREWDDDGNGLVDKKEFRKAVSALGFQASKEDINAVFDAIDIDGGGTLEYSELNKAFRRGGSIKLDRSLEPGAAGAIELKAKNKFGSASVKSGSGRYSIGAAQSASQRSLSSSTSKLTTQDLILEDLHKTLARNAPRLEQLFKRWDTNGDGQIDRKEWAEALPMIGINTTSEMIAKLFDELDTDGSGTIDITELRAAVRERTSRKPGSQKALTASPVRTAVSKQGSAQLSPPRNQSRAEYGGSKQLAASQKPGGRLGNSRLERGPQGREAKPPPAVTQPREAPEPEVGYEPEEDAALPVPLTPPKSLRHSARSEYVNNSTRENPFTDMKLALEAAPLGLRVLGMPAVDDWGGRQNTTLGEGEERQLSRFEAALRSELDDVGDLGADATGTEATAAFVSADEIAAMEARREAAREEAAAKAEDQRQADAATFIQSGYRGLTTRRTNAFKGNSRQWRFHKFHRRSFKTTPGERNRASFYVEKHETLQIVAVDGTGRLVIDATTPDGEIMVAKGVVYDSSAHALLHPNAPKGIHGKTQALWATPGEFEYVLSAEPLVPGGPPADMTVTFRVEMLLTGFDLVSEPPMPRPIAHHNVGSLLTANAKKKTSESEYVQRRMELELSTEASKSAVQPADEPLVLESGEAADISRANPANQSVYVSVPVDSWPQEQQLRPVVATAAPAGLSLSFDAAQSRAQEIEDAQTRSEMERGAAHLLQLDTRSYGQLQRVQSHSQLQPPAVGHGGLRASPSMPTVAGPTTTQAYPGAQYYGYAGHAYPGGQPGVNSVGWPEGTAAYYYSQLGGGKLVTAPYTAYGVEPSAIVPGLTPGVRSGLGGAPAQQGFQGVAAAPGRRPAGRRRR